MMAPLRLILREPRLRLVAALLFLFGAFMASLAPYQSLLAIEVFSLSHRAYAGLLILGGAVFVTASVSLGILSDQRVGRRGLALICTLLLAAGAGLVAVRPSPTTFAVAHGLLLPVGSTIFAQSFALARVALSLASARDTAAALTALRAFVALPFVAILPLWSLAFGKGLPLIALYPALAALGLAMALLILLLWPRRAGWHDPKSGMSFAAALAEFRAPGIARRTILLGAVGSAVGLYMVLIGLIFAEAGRGPADVALYVGFVAGAEVPFMLLLPLVQHRFRAATLIAAGAGVYACHLALLAPLSALPAVWVLILCAALGGAAILTLPIGYTQMMMTARPGAGTSLLAFQRIVADTICAALFAFGTWAAGYWLAALLGAVVSVGAGLWLRRIDGQG